MNFMKYLIIGMAILLSAQGLKAQQKQSLKDLLYSGKLKKDSSGVIRSTDDLSSKIDTSTKKPEAEVAKAPVTEPARPAVVAADTAKKVASTTSQPVATQKEVLPTENPVNTTTSTTTAPNTNPPAAENLPSGTPAGEVATTAAATTTAPAAPKTNTKLWKEYSDELTKSLQEALKSKQVKKGTYFMMIDYEIGTDGKVTFLDVSSEPSNSYLQSQVKQVLDSTPFTLNPVMDSANQPRKVKRKQSYSITKG